MFDALGRRVARVDYGRRGAGLDELLWEGVDEAGRPLAAGVYVYRLQAGEQEATGQFVKAPRPTERSGQGSGISRAR